MFRIYAFLCAACLVSILGVKDVTAAGGVHALLLPSLAIYFFLATLDDLDQDGQRLLPLVAPRPSKKLPWKIRLAYTAFFFSGVSLGGELLGGLQGKSMRMDLIIMGASGLLMSVSVIARNNKASDNDPPERR